MLPCCSVRELLPWTCLFPAASPPPHHWDLAHIVSDADGPDSEPSIHLGFFQDPSLVSSSVPCTTRVIPLSNIPCLLCHPASPEDGLPGAKGSEWHQADLAPAFCMDLKGGGAGEVASEIFHYWQLSHPEGMAYFLLELEQKLRGAPALV